MQVYRCSLVSDGRVGLGATLPAAILAKAMVVRGTWLVDQQEGDCFGSAGNWRTASRTPADENEHPGLISAEPATYDCLDLCQTAADLREGIRARDDFVAIAAHELRNAMAPIDGVLDLALQTARDANSDCPPRVTILLERMQRLVDDFLKRATKLLDISRIETGSFVLEPSIIDLSSLVISVVQRYEVIAAQRGGALVTEIEGEISGMWDPHAVGQIVENLLSNAIKFGMRKPVTIRLQSEKQLVRLEVRDRGMGMRSDQRSNIFGRFEQAVTQHRSSGSGIGLWVTNRLVAAMKGRLLVESRSGEGSNFVVELPRISLMAP